MVIIEANISTIETMEDRGYAAILYKTLRCCGPFCTTNSPMYTRAALRTQRQATLRALRPRDHLVRKRCCRDRCTGAPLLSSLTRSFKKHAACHYTLIQRFT